MKSNVIVGLGRAGFGVKGLGFSVVGRTLRLHTIVPNAEIYTRTKSDCFILQEDSAGCSGFGVLGLGFI